MIDSPERKCQNITYITSTKTTDIISAIKELPGEPKAGHFTNGTYAADADLIIPTTIAGFHRVTQTYPHLPLIIAINSDKSMAALGKEDFETQEVRAKKVAIPLAQYFSNKQIIIMYYDEKTPKALYHALSEKKYTRTLHKWGYGTSDEEPKIEGAEYFEFTYAFPLPNNTKPACYGDTDKPTKKQKVIVDDLRDKLINEEGLLIDDLPDVLEKYHSSKKSKPTLGVL